MPRQQIAELQQILTSRYQRRELTADQYAALMEDTELLAGRRQQ